MFINRSGNKLKTQKVTNQFNQSQNLDQLRHSDLGMRELQLISYPALSYIFGFFLVSVSIYLIYSASGGVNSIPNFNNNLWWQYLLAFIPMLFGFGFISFCQIQKLYISRKSNKIVYTKTRLFCFITQQIVKQFTDLIGLSVIRTGTERNNINMVYYHIVMSFSTVKEMEVLACLSESAVTQYFEQIRRYFDKSQISQKKIIIQNLVN